jgi:hypothetical protein
LLHTGMAPVTDRDSLRHGHPRVWKDMHLLSQTETHFQANPLSPADATGEADHVAPRGSNASAPSTPSAHLLCAKHPVQPRAVAGTTKMVASGLLLVCLLATADGATKAGMRAPRRICSEHSSLHPWPGSSPRGSPGIPGGSDVLETPGCILAPMQRSTTHSRRLSYIGDRQDHHDVHAAHDDSVYEALQPRRRWSPEPVTSPPPLRTYRPDEEYTYIKTKLYPHLSF